VQAGLNPLMVRCDRSNEAAHSVNAEFISGNYFRIFGLRSAAGGLLQDSDDVQGALITAVMSYALRGARLCARLVGRGFHLLDQYQAGDHRGHRPGAVLRRSHAEHAAWCLSTHRVAARVARQGLCS
jgi:hypothetical protein